MVFGKQREISTEKLNEVLETSRPCMEKLVNEVNKKGWWIKREQSIVWTLMVTVFKNLIKIEKEKVTRIR